MTSFESILSMTNLESLLRVSVTVSPTFSIAKPKISNPTATLAQVAGAKAVAEWIFDFIAFILISPHAK